MRYGFLRALSLVLCAALLLPALAACGKGGGSTDGPAEPEKEGPFGTPGEVSAYDGENTDYTLSIDAGDRVQNACILLRNTDYPAADISAICGYESPEHFSASRSISARWGSSLPERNIPVYSPLRCRLRNSLRLIPQTPTGTTSGAVRSGSR